eukprot:COSAG05_NODE_2406_length_3102_cov_1.630703_3_plen_446_part_00
MRGSDALSLELRPMDGEEASTDDEGEIPPVSRFGALLGRTSPGCACCPACAVCPTGSVAVLLISLLISLGIAGWGVRDPERLNDDVKPNVDGFAPRRSDVGDRGNTYNLLFQPNGFNKLISAEGICAEHGICLTHNPPGRRRLGGSLAPPSASSDAVVTTRMAPPATSRRLQGMPGAPVFCPHDNSTNPETFRVLFGSRELAVDDGCGGDDCSAAAQLTVLTGAKLAAMCAWEDALYALPTMQQNCQGPGGGRAIDAQGDATLKRCCRPLSVARVVATLVGKACSDLADADIATAMGSLLACRASEPGSDCSTFSAHAPEHVSEWADALCGDALGNHGMLPNGVCPPQPEAVEGGGKPIAPTAVAWAGEWTTLGRKVAWLRTKDISFPSVADDSVTWDQREDAEFQLWKQFGEPEYSDNAESVRPAIVLVEMHWFLLVLVQLYGL